MKAIDILENWGNSRNFGSGERPQDQQLIEKSKRVKEVIDPGVGMGSPGGQWANSKMEDWNKVNHHDHTDGLSQKAVNAYRRENPGSKLKTAVTTKPSKLKKGSKAAKRRKSFCARMSGNKGPMRKPNGKPTPKALALRRWNCESVEEMAQMILEGQHMIAEIKKGAKDSNGYSSCWKGFHASGTKKGKNGGQVRNCVKNEDLDTPTQQPGMYKDPKTGKMVQTRSQSKMAAPNIPGTKDSMSTKPLPKGSVPMVKKDNMDSHFDIRTRYNSTTTEGVMPVGPVVAALRMFNRKREAYELFTRKFPSVQEAETWASKNNAELHKVSPVEAKSVAPVDLDNMLSQISTARKFGD